MESESGKKEQTPLSTFIAKKSSSYNVDTDEDFLFNGSREPFVVIVGPQ
jgi:hypothetical protein